MEWPFDGMVQLADNKMSFLTNEAFPTFREIRLTNYVVLCI